MLINKIILLFLSLGIYLSGWMTPFQLSDWEKEDPVAKNVQTIRQHIAAKRWDLAKREAKKLPRIFEQQKWKYQMIGDEGEYEEVDHEISKLSVIVELEDQSEALITLASILKILREIYSM
jgi:hypothetical protein